MPAISECRFDSFNDGLNALCRIEDDENVTGPDIRPYASDPGSSRKELFQQLLPVFAAIQRLNFQTHTSGNAIVEGTNEGDRWFCHLMVRRLMLF